MLLTFERIAVRAVTRETRFVTRPDPHWLNISTYAQAYGVDRKTVYKWLAAGLLESFQVGLVIRIKHQPPVERRQAPRAEENTQ